MFDVLFSSFFIHENEGIGPKGYEQIENTFIFACCVSESSVNKRIYILFYSLLLLLLLCLLAGFGAESAHLQRRKLN